MKVTTTKYCDRWDLLAYDLLGDTALAPALMAANRHLIDLYDSHIPEGVEIVIPEQLPVRKPLISTVKAPWKD
ncbi:MAG: tail protein X [Rikenellaceae bacterium]|jgi:phage tail protein X|nr:tail protein X [Rikenellaceae bacterium]